MTQNNRIKRKEYWKFLFVVFLLFFAIIVINIASKEETSERNLNNQNRILLWQDEFDVFSENIWDYEIGYIRNNDIQYYMPSEENVICEDGLLHLKAKKNNPDAEHEWSSGSVIARKGFAFGYGYIEARIKYLPQNGCGAAFWCKGTDYWRDYEIAENLGEDWPNCGELDIAEFSSNERLCPGGFWYDEESDGKKSSGRGTYAIDDEWHIYGMERTATEIVFFFDGNEVCSIERTAYNSELFIDMIPQFNLMLSYDDGSIQECEMLVDWIRYYAPRNVTHYQDPTRVEIGSVDQIELRVGQERVLSPQFDIEYPSNAHIDWFSSDEETVSCYGGVLKAKKDGTVTIRAKSVYGYEDEISVVVSDKAQNPITDIQLFGESNKMEFGDILALRTLCEPSYHSNKAFNWESSDNSVAIVCDGKVTAVNPSGGTVIITCYSDDYSVSGKFEITCNPYPEDNLPTEGLIVKYTRCGWSEGGWKSDISDDVISTTGDTESGFDYRVGLGYKQNYIEQGSEYEESGTHVLETGQINPSGPFSIVLRFFYPKGKDNTTGFLFELSNSENECGAIYLTSDCLYVKSKDGNYNICRLRFNTTEESDYGRAINAILTRSEDGLISLYINGEKISGFVWPLDNGTLPETEYSLKIGSETIPTGFYQACLAYDYDMAAVEIQRVFEALSIMYK